MPGGSKHEKILVVLTNVSRYHGTEEPTGLWLGEATEFVEEVTKAGFSVDYVSPQGGYVPLDPRSMKYVDSSIMAVYESADFQERALAHSSLLKKLSQMNTQQFTLQEAMALCGTFLIILSCKQSL